MECVRRAVAVEVESPPPELYAVEEPYRRIVEEVAVYVAERGALGKEKYSELYHRFRRQYPLPAQLIQQAINQGVETGRSFLQRKKDGRVHKPRPEVRRVSIRFPRGHAVDRDAAAVLNMLWKTTPTGWLKGVWWDVKEARKRLKKGIVPRETVRKTNPIIPRPIIHAVLASLMALKASDKWPAVLARAAPMTPAQGADEDGTRAPPRLKGAP